MTTKHTVQAGESMSTIAQKFGFSDWNTLWKDAENASLKKKRNNPNVLYPGDVVTIPEVEIKQESAATDQKHEFTCKLPKMKDVLRLQLDDENGEPMAEQDCIVTLDNETELNLTTDGEGIVEIEIPINVRSAKIEIDGCEWPLEIGQLNPVDEPTEDNNISGAQSRLNNLGFDCPTSDELDDRTQQAIKAFQSTQKNLDITGQLDKKTCSALKKEHGC